MSTRSDTVEVGPAVGNQINLVKYTYVNGAVNVRGTGEEITPCQLTFYNEQIDDTAWNIHLYELLNRLQLFLSTTPIRATWASGVIGHQASSPLTWRTINLLYDSFHSYLTEISIFGSVTQSPLITDFILICLCLDFGIFCHVDLFPLNVRPELLSKDTSANSYPLNIVSASKSIRTVTLTHRSTLYWLLATVFFAKFQCQTCEWSQSPWLSDPISHPFLFQPLQASH